MKNTNLTSHLKPTQENKVVSYMQVFPELTQKIYETKNLDIVCSLLS